jgi:putative DNA primase/helicase
LQAEALANGNSEHVNRDIDLLDNFPDEPKALQQWVSWRKKRKRNSKSFDKIPLNANTGKAAAVDNPSTWAAYHIAVEAYAGGLGDGIGFVLTEEDPYCCIDLDHCRDKKTGYLESWASEIVEQCDSYTEVTPSEEGVRIWMQGRLPGTGGNNSKGFEIYDRRRFLTITGEHIGGTLTTIELRQGVIDFLYQKFFPEKVREKPFTKSKTHSLFSDADRAAILAELKDALPHIPAVDHDLWLHVGMGIHSVDAGDAGFDLWVGWSKTCPEKFDFDDCVKRWRSFHDDGGITHRSIFALAIEHGWRNTGARQAYRNGAAHHHENNDTQTDPWKRYFRCTDLGNGERFIAHYGKNLLFCNPWKSFLTWDERRWELDNSQKVRRWARLVVRGIYEEAKRATDQAQNADSEEKKEKFVKRAKKLLQHAVKSEAEARINAMIHNAQMDCPVMPEELDGDPWVLNVANGTIDLQTGALRPHRREDRLTKLIPIEYDPFARCSLWEAFLDAVMAGNQELIDFLQKAIGYSLTGDCREDCLFLLYGLGANGKSTFLEIIRAVLREYAKQAEFSTFLHKDKDSVRNDVADLRGARFVSAVEVDEGRRLSEALIKSLTGRDTMKARFLFQEHFEFRPQLKLWLAANNKPVIRGMDDGIWRRIRLVPFTVKFEGNERDKELPEKLKAELPGILAWAVRGCLAWQEEGLPIPEAVQVATDGYRKEMDVMGNFLEEICEQKPHLRVKAGDLYNAYISWSGDKHITQTAFGRALNERGIAREKTSGTVWRLGVALLTQQDS